MKQPELGDYIANLRKEQGLTQEELVELCNINVRTIQRIEAGDVTPRNYTIKNILQALGSSFEEITRELHEQPATKKAPENLLRNPNHGLLIAIVGILYIFTSFPLVMADITAATGDRMLGTITYSIIAISYLILVFGFYLGIGYSMKTKSHLLKSCIWIFLGIELLSSIYSFLWYVDDTQSTQWSDLAPAIFIQVAYGLSLIILAVPFFFARDQFTGIFRYLGVIALVAGICHLTFILFPIGIIGTLLFDILLVILMFQYYQRGREVIG